MDQDDYLYDPDEVQRLLEEAIDASIEEREEIEEKIRDATVGVARKHLSDGRHVSELSDREVCELWREIDDTRDSSLLSDEAFRRNIMEYLQGGDLNELENSIERE